MRRLAIRNLLSRPIRAALAILGLAVAIAGMVGLFSIAGGLDRAFEQTFKRIPGLLVVQSGAPIPLFSSLPGNWKEKLTAIQGVHVVVPEVWMRANVIEGKPVFSPPRFLCGTSISDHLRISHPVYQSDMVAGRFLQEADRGTTNALISRPIADQFRKQVGDKFQVNGVELTVVGIYHCKSLLLDVTILLDIEVLRKVGRFDVDSVSNYYIEPDDDVSASQLQTEVERVCVALAKAENVKASGLLSRGLGSLLGTPGDGNHALPSETSPKTSDGKDGEGPVEVRTASEWQERFESLSGDLNLFLTLMTAVGISIALFSIVNTMLMSVQERIIEFGILRANGWSQRDLVTLIGYESSLLGFVGGVIGAVIGWIATLVINAWFHNRLQLHASWGLLLFGIGFSTLLGLVGGIYPAYRTSRVSPMQAIRQV